MKLEDIKPQDQIIGLIPGDVATVIQVEKSGNDAITVVYRSSSGKLGEQILYRDKEDEISLATRNLAWSFDSPAKEFKLALEAKRMNLASLFDPMMAVNSSDIEPLPHQIAAVYDSMLPKLPLRFVLADDPGAGKTIMAGLLIKELISRGDVERVLIVAPGSLVEQWQDEMREKFGLIFNILTTEGFESSATGNFFEDQDLLIARLDQLARDNDEIFLPRLRNSKWDLVIVDEAHKMAAHMFGNKLSKTQRFLLGEDLSKITRHFLLMTATPHNGKEEDFQAWLSLLDPDRFYTGKTTDNNTERPDLSDIMRRLIKEELLKFDGTRLFPHRVAETVNFELSKDEQDLYEDVTRYVVDEMNRAERLLNKKQSGQVGFALTLLQRRLASSPSAIYQSLRRRRERLEKRLQEVKLGKANLDNSANLADVSPDMEDEIEPENYEETVNNILDNAAAAQNIPELEAEIVSLKALEAKAKKIYDSGSDTKWSKLSETLQGNQNFKENRRLKKLIIFTEHKDTLDYLNAKINNLMGNIPGAVLVIEGKTKRDARREIQEKFRNDDSARILLATDAAGEGVNLQCASMMINYDLPWNPNRIEQRFGRIHRIGQTKECHLWNLVAVNTREGQVFNTLFDKIKLVSDSLKGKVFDVLGQAFEGVGNTLQELILKAIREEDSEANKRWMTEKIDAQLDIDNLQKLMQQYCLSTEVMTKEDVYRVKEEMDKAEARKLQPCFVRSFFLDALKNAKGSYEQRSKTLPLYKVRNVPSYIRNNKHFKTLSRKPILDSYDRVCFSRQYIHCENGKLAEFIHPGHPLMRSLIDYTLTQYQTLFKPGTVLVDPADDGVIPSVLCLIEHEILENGSSKPVSKRLQFVRITQDDKIQNAGWAPHLDLKAPDQKALEIAAEIKTSPWISNDLETKAVHYAIDSLSKEHLQTVQSQRINWINKVETNVKQRLNAAIRYYEKQMRKAESQPDSQLRNANIAKARMEKEELTHRLNSRIEEFKNQRNLISSPPVVLGGILVIPQGLINQKTGVGTFSTDPQARSIIERIAMEAVMENERAKGNEVIDVSAEKCGWDVTSRPPRNDNDERISDDIHIEVKGRVKGADTITVTRNEVCYALNQKDKFRLAIVLIDGDQVVELKYIRNPFDSELQDGQVSGNFEMNYLLSKADP